MESQTSPQSTQTIRDLMALSEIEEDESFENLDQLLDTTIDHSDYDDGEGTTTTDIDIEKMLQSVEISTNFLLSIGNSSDNVEQLGQVDTSAAILSVPNDSNDERLILKVGPQFSSSSPIHPTPKNTSMPLISNNMFMSPTTLLNSLLSQSDIDGSSEKERDMARKLSSFSVDDTASFLNADMDINNKALDGTDFDVDVSVLDDNVHEKSTEESPIAILDQLIANISSEEDDGLDSFVTAREDGDATSTVNSKASTVVTVMVENKSSPTMILRIDESNATTIGVPDAQTAIDAEDNTLRTTIDRQITGSVSFHEATDVSNIILNAPLWDDDDPSTPKRSGKESVQPIVPNSNTIAHEATTEHQNPITIDTNTSEAKSIHDKDIIDTMGNVTSGCDKDVTNDQDAIDDKGSVYLTNHPSTAIVALSADIESLFVPCLSEVNSTESKDAVVRDDTDKPSEAAEGQVKEMDYENNIGENIIPDQSQFTGSEVSVPDRTVDHSNSTTDELLLKIEHNVASEQAVHQPESIQEDEICTMEIPPALVAEAKRDLSNLPTRSDDDNRSILNADVLNSFAIQKAYTELKSLQVEFPSLLNKYPKKSDVSLSSASSTISHGSFSKTQASAMFASAENDEQQHRRNKSNESLPPRSPRKGTTPLDSQKFSSSSTVKQFSPVIDFDENDTERVETKWMKQSLSMALNPRRSIFAGKVDRKGRQSSISPPGSPPEPCYSDPEDDDVGSFHDETRTSVSSSIKVNSAPGLWDMIAHDELVSDEGWVNKTDYVTSDHGGIVPANQNRCNGESIAESSVSPSEVDVIKSKPIATKLSFKSDISFSSSVVKRTGLNKPLSLSQHSKGSFGSTLSSKGKKEKRLLITPLGSKTKTQNSRFLELDASSLGRCSSQEASSPERIPLFSMHSSSPDLYKLNEESQSSYQTSPIKSIEINTLPQTERGIDGSCFIADAKPHDLVSPESLVQKYSLYQESDSITGEENASNLQELLLEFSTVHPLNIPLRNITLPGPIRDAGILKWRQLVVNWKHSEVFRAMISGTSYSSIFETRFKSNGERNSAESAESGRPNPRINDNLKLYDVQLRPESGKPGSRMYSQLSPQDRNPTLSTFLTEIGSGSFETANQRLRHLVSTSGTEATLDLLLETARKNVHVVTSLVNDVIAFASISSHPERESITHAIDVKDRATIVRKAKMKYSDDIFQVKDILRAQITFRNDGELVCGLVRLLQTVKTDSSAEIVSSEKVTLIRIKNLFSCTPGSLIPMSPLPTGYRHVLLNLRLQSGLIFELQFNLLPIFTVLGQEGYSLHRTLIDMKDCLTNEELAANNTVAFDMNALIAKTIDCGSEKWSLTSFFDVTNLSKPDEIGEKEGNEKATIEGVVLLHESSISKVVNNSSNNAHCSNSLNGIAMKCETLRNESSGHHIFLAILQCGANDLSTGSSPRDVATYWCIYGLLSFVLKMESESTVEVQPIFFDYARQCLLRCLTLSNQSVSLGMTGWLEYGSNNIFHSLGQQCEIVRHLAYNFARRKRWMDAEGVCRALVIHCDEHLPLHHPTTLTALFDLALSSSMIGNQLFTDRILHRAAERLSKYLCEAESSYATHLSNMKPVGNQGETLFRIEHGRDAIFALHAFVSLFRSQLNRDMVLLVGVRNEIVLTNYSFVADTLSVLANCVAAANFFLGSKSEVSDDCGLPFWQMAYMHYEVCYTGFAATKSLDDPAVLRSVFGIARCLREFGETEKALKLLSLVVAFKGGDDGTPLSVTADIPLTEKLDEFKVEDGSIKENYTKSPTPRFLPITPPRVIDSDKSLMSKSMSLALCLWLMANLSVEQQRNEEGRERAFGCLHAAAMSLQASLHSAAEASNDYATRAMCIRFLAMIEDEAEQISEPIYE